MRLLLALLLALSTSVHAQQNLGFEQGEAGALPPGWIAPTAHLGYEVVAVAENAKEGEKAARIRRTSDTAPGARDFGNLMQSIDASAYRGKVVRLRAAIRFTPAADAMGQAQLWFRVDRPEKQVGFFDNMTDRPVRSRDWAYYEIVGDVASDATKLNFGLILIGRGEAWIDDVSLTVIEKTETKVEPARPLTPRGLDNLTAFARLFGYVRHFHPSDQAAAAQWDRVAVEGVRAIESAKDAKELAEKLEAYFRPYAPTLRVGITGSDLKIDAGSGPQVVSWRHKGFGQPTSIYKSERIRIDSPDANADPRVPFQADLAGGVSIALPLALYVDDQGTLPHVETPKEPEKVERYTGNDRATRLADVILAWNVFQHFYPYFDVIKTDWNAVLRPTLQAAATDKDEAAFLQTLRGMIAKLDDGHGSVSHPSESARGTLPLALEWIENKLVVTEVGKGVEGVKVGDIIERIDGRVVADLLREREPFISAATADFRRRTAIRALAGGPLESTVQLALDGSRNVTLKRTADGWQLTGVRPPKVHELEPGIFYLDPQRMEESDWTNALQQLASARGIIFDMRGYPSIPPAFLQHLTSKPLQSAIWNVPVITRPDRTGKSEHDASGRWTLEPMQPRLDAKIVFLTDSRAISYAETIMGIVEAYDLGTIVGEPTAATNGNVNPFTLPGGYRVMWTGMQVLKHDGSRHHGVGIQPDVPLSRTIAGVRAGRDEQLEKALALIRSQSPTSRTHPPAAPARSGTVP